MYNSFSLAVGSPSPTVALVLYDMENAPHVLLLIHKTLSGPTAVVLDT